MTWYRGPVGRMQPVDGRDPSKSARAPSLATSSRQHAAPLLPRGQCVSVIRRPWQSASPGCLSAFTGTRFACHRRPGDQLNTGENGLGASTIARLEWSSGQSKSPSPASWRANQDRFIATSPTRQSASSRMRENRFKEYVTLGLAVTSTSAATQAIAGVRAAESGMRDDAII
jgi:hypothetical protein